MKTLFVALPLPSHTSTRILGISESMESLPTVYEPCEVYAVRTSPAVIDEVRELMSREHTAGKALGLLRRVAHSFTFVGNINVNEYTLVLSEEEYRSLRAIMFCTEVVDGKVEIDVLGASMREQCAGIPNGFCTEMHGELCNADIGEVP